MKVGEIVPNINIEQIRILHDNGNGCDRPFLIEKPGGLLERTTFFSMKFFETKTFVCLRCNWESGIITKRII